MTHQRQRALRGLSAVLFSTLWLLHCGDDGSSAPDKCVELITLYCGRTVECLASSRGVQATDALRDFCVDEANVRFGCERVKAVGATYDECLAAIADLSCSGADDETFDNELPATCNSVLLT